MTRNRWSSTASSICSPRAPWPITSNSSCGRFVLVQRAAAETASAAVEEPALGFYCALARQCFINEYVFACGEDELAQAQELRERLAAALASGAAIPVLWPVAVAAYFPL